MDSDAVIRLVAERELATSTSIELEAGDCIIMFHLETISAEIKRKVRQVYDANFPVPPVVSTSTPIGPIVRFDVEDANYQKQLATWHESLSYGVLAATIGLTGDEVRVLETLVPSVFMSKLFSTAELINGVQSEPLADLIKEAIWSPEVLAWIETYKGKPDDVKITDRPLFRQMEAMVDAGLSFSDWEELTPRQRILILNWHDYKAVREGYINWWTISKNAPVESRNPMRLAMDRL